MHPNKRLFLLEMAHIPLWLIKDLCWLMTWRTTGIIMAVPTVTVAIVLALLTKKDSTRFLPNVSIAFWIIANANWMVAEFFELPIRFFSIVPFTAGILVFMVYLYKQQQNGWDMNDGSKEN